MQLDHSFLVSVPVNRNSTVLYFQYDSVCNTCEQEILAVGALLLQEAYEISHKLQCTFINNAILLRSIGNLLDNYLKCSSVLKTQTLSKFY